MKYYKQHPVLECLSLTPSYITTLDLYSIHNLYELQTPLKGSEDGLHPLDDDEMEEYTTAYSSLLKTTQDVNARLLVHQLPYEFEEIKNYLTLEGVRDQISKVIKVKNYDILFGVIKEYITKPIVKDLRTSVVFNGVCDSDLDFLLYKALFASIVGNTDNHSYINTFLEHFIVPIVLECVLLNKLDNDVNVEKIVESEFNNLLEGLKVNNGDYYINEQINFIINDIEYYRDEDEFPFAYDKDNNLYFIKLEEEKGIPNEKQYLLQQ